jgi:hypothetical protein
MKARLQLQKSGMATKKITWQRNSPLATLRKKCQAVQMKRMTHLVVHLLRK